MRVWLIQRSEPTPHDNAGAQRAMRTGILAQMLLRKGHRVVWWTSTFDHFNRRHRHQTDARLSVESGYEIQYLHGCGYVKNMSVSRVRDNFLVAKRFMDLSRKDQKLPDIILASIPTVELCLSAVNYAKKRNIPVFIDIRDLWPDVFFDLVPVAFRPIVRLLSTPMERKAKNACKTANGILGITDAFVDWGVAHAGRPRSNNDRTFPMGYLADGIDTGRVQKGKIFWRNIFAGNDNSELIVIFLGTLGKGFDFNAIFQAATILEQSHVPIKLIICGAGERADEIKKQVQGLSNVLFPGWVNAEQIKALLELADVGIAPYIERRDFINSIPNKAAEYLSGGLAIALSLNNGALFDLLVQQKCGFSYSSRAEKLAAKLEFMVRNPSHLKALQSNALTTYKKSFDAVTVYTRLTNFLEQRARTSHEHFHKKTL